MSAKNKIRGAALEKEVYDLAKVFNLPAEKAYASVGRTIGHHDQVDVTIWNYTVQCKRFKQFPRCFDDLLPTTHNTDIVVFRKDGRPKNTYAVIELDELMNLIKRYYNLELNNSYDEEPDCG